jgi:anti-sigma-K factor RskA
MNDHLDAHLTLCASHAVGCMDDRERRHLLEHLALRCEPCATALEEFRRAVLVLARSVPLSRPSRALRTRVMSDALLAVEQRIRDSDAGTRVLEVRSSQALSWKGWGFLYLAIVLAVVAGIAWLEVQRLRVNLAETGILLNRLSQKYAAETYWSDVLTSPAVRVANLAPAAIAWPAVHGRANFDPATGRALVMCSSLPAGDYVLWGRDGSGWRRLGSVRPDQKGTAVARLEHIGDTTLAALALSLEPPNGAASAGPAGPVVLRGEFGR